MLKLGCYLVPRIDIGPAVMAKILTENGQVIQRLTYRTLTPDGLLDTDEQAESMIRVYERFGSQIPMELENIELENAPW